MWFRYPIIIFTFLFLILLQIGFFPYFSILGTTPNLVFIVFFLIIFFEDNEIEFFSVITAGFFLDMFSPSYFGISMGALLLVYFLQKAIKYFLKRAKEDNLVAYFMIVFLVSFIFYNGILYIASIIFNFNLSIGWNFVVSIIYNLVFATLGFFIYKMFRGQDYLENQLKLL